MNITIKLGKDENIFEHITFSHHDNQKVLDISLIENFPNTKIFICKNPVKNTENLSKCKNIEKIYLGSSVEDDINFKSFFMNFENLNEVCMNFKSSKEISDLISFSKVKIINGCTGMDFPDYRTIFEFPKYECPKISYIQNW